MFRPIAEPLLLSEAVVYGLCLSLNAPVLNVSRVPVGPARAAILLHGGEDGRLGLVVGLRSLETGSVVVYAYAGDLDETLAPTEAMDAALAFAERMGFLFDEDLVARQGREEALRRWSQLVDGLPADADGAGAFQFGAHSGSRDAASELRSGGGVEDDDGLDSLVLELDAADSMGEGVAVELTLLEEPKVTAADARAEGAREPGAKSREAFTRSGPSSESVCRPPPVGEGHTLTKFRRPGTAPGRGRSQEASSSSSRSAATPISNAMSDSGSDSTSGSALGRIPIVRKRVGGEGPSRPSLLIRLLSQF